jgi:cell wall-associated NlpC family hydrolase
MIMTSDQVCAAALRFVGTPFHHQARLPGVGLDCLGVIVAVMHELGLPGREHDLTDYPRWPNPETLYDALAKAMDGPYSPENLDCGHVGLFWIESPGVPRHVAIRVPNGIVHAHEGVGRVVLHGYTEAWSKRCMASYRLRGVV